jgi:hypothetical protein
VGRFWAVGPQLTNDNQREVLEQMEQWGATPAQIKQYKDKLQPDECEILEENADAVKWFLTVDDLFNYDPQSGVIFGLDIKAIQADMQMRGMDPDPENYEKVRIIGRAAAHAHNNKRSS